VASSTSEVLIDPRHPRRRRNWRRIVLAVAALALCDIAVGIPGYIYVRPWVEHIVRPFHGGPERRHVDASALLFPDSVLTATGVLSALAINPPLTRDLGNEGDNGHTYLRDWYQRPPRSSYLDVHEEITVFSNTDDAAAFMHYSDARKHYLAENPSVTGPPTSPHVPGAPSTSSYFCSDVESQGCDGWIWTARYGQYRVYLEYESIAPGQLVALPQADFNALVLGCATRIAARP
jgi:hypothetical protein